MTSILTDEQWAQHQQKGYLRLGRVTSDEDLKALQARIDAIMLGEADLDYSRILMQLDSPDGKYENAGEQSPGHKGATLAYRKIQDLEQDDLFLEFMERPIFREICAREYGAQTPIAAFRAMFMNKPAHQGTLLPWHQDRWSDLDRDPLVTLWTALDPATVENGCVQIIEGSHQFGLLNPEHPSGYVTPAQADELLGKYPVVPLELEAGHAVLLHNWLLHASDKNHSAQSRRAFSVCYMDGETQSQSGARFTRVFEGEMAGAAR